jgi:hypothetical protein
MLEQAGRSLGSLAKPRGGAYKVPEPLPLLFVLGLRVTTGLLRLAVTGDSLWVLG